MDNPVGKYFEFPLLKEELFVALLIHEVFCLVVHIEGRRQKNHSIICVVPLVDNSQLLPLLTISSSTFFPSSIYTQIQYYFSPILLQNH